jgi:hypothetical protein
VINLIECLSFHSETDGKGAKGDPVPNMPIRPPGIPLRAERSARAEDNRKVEKYQPLLAGQIGIGSHHRFGKEGYTPDRNLGFRSARPRPPRNISHDSRAN